MLKLKTAPQTCIEQFQSQWKAITATLRKPTACLRALFKAEPEWEYRVAVIGVANCAYFEQRTLFLERASAATARLKGMAATQTKEGRAAYEKWVDNQLRIGVGAMNRLAKREDLPHEEAVYGMAEFRPGNDSPTQ